ncbi:MAG: GntR family transcriptional regulator, partial [Baekduiaceae bacterium]
MSTDPLPRVSAVDALVTVLRDRILEGELPAGERLVERELTERYDVARHTLRAALRALEAEGLVRIEPNRGARVAQLDADELRDLFALRLALEREAAHLALERHDGRLPAPVHDAAAQLARRAATRRTGWAGVA